MITVLLVATAFAATEPCLLPLSVSESLLAPRDGSVAVPTNARIILVNVPVGDTTLNDDDGPVEFDTATLPVDIGSSSPFEAFVLTPRLPLVAGRTVTVTTGDIVAGSFVVGDAANLVAPAAPTASVGPFSGGACSPSVEVTIDGGDDLAFALASLGDDSDAAGLSVGSQLIVAGPANETTSISVRAVDLADNTSEPTVIDATFPAAFSPGWGCSSNAGAGAPTFFALLLLGLGLRRRQR